MNDLSMKLAELTGVDAGDVSRVLSELSSLAYANVASGFVLPGFGKFQLLQGAETIGINPFTGEETVFRAPPEVEFILDTNAEKSFLAGKPEQQISKFGENEAGKTLRSIRLIPSQQDMAQAGIEIENEKLLHCKVGGAPDWIQSPETPICCGESMTFYGQLNSLGGEYCLGDMGRLYVFYCESCLNSRSILQF